MESKNRLLSSCQTPISFQNVSLAQWLLTLLLFFGSLQLHAQSGSSRFTVSGYVRTPQAESLINATVFDPATGTGTTTNEYGFYSLTLPTGKHHLKFSYVGYGDVTHEVDLTADRRMDVVLKADMKLPEVVVRGDLNSSLLNTQTGKRSLGQSDIKTEFSLFSSPDVIKTLQRISGVQAGTELASGLYVHGGGADENLFLLDGTPLYQVNHAMGLFSSFNADVIKNVDFYKSGFPARYGGRLSSVVDVRTNDGDMFKHHGLVRVGLLEGSLQFEGPIKRGQTSYNIGLRRSWLDLLSRPIIAIANKRNNEEKITLNYLLYDLNAKLTHIISDRSKLFLSVYSGKDGFHVGDKYYDYADRGDFDSWDKYKNDFTWGNVNVALNWNYIFSPRLFANFTGVYTRNNFDFNTIEDERYLSNAWGDKKTYQVDHDEHRFRSTIDDMGYRADFDFIPSPKHHLRFGQHYIYHIFRPQTSVAYSYVGETGDTDNKVDTLRSSSRNRLTAHEWTLYAEDEVNLGAGWKTNFGFNANLFSISGKAFAAFDPRFSLKKQLTKELSAKASYTRMTQYVHKISNAFIDLPTDYWVPTTRNTRPMTAQQFAGGLYWQPGNHWETSAEAFYKTTRHLLQFTNWLGIEPPAESWDLMVMDGKGRAYGIELDATYRTAKFVATGAYTWSHSQRFFEEYYPTWYDDIFDSRHKLDLTARYQPSKKVSIFAAFVWRSGHRATIPMQYAEKPLLPDYRDMEFIGNADYAYFYTTPNNVQLPAYHRLDVGADFKHITKKGHERIWNVSIYNAYCHWNTMWIKVKYDNNQKRFTAKAKGFIPIIPSVSYTLKF